jgi:hypothetical protein
MAFALLTVSGLDLQLQDKVLVLLQELVTRGCHDNTITSSITLSESECSVVSILLGRVLLGGVTCRMSGVWYVSYDSENFMITFSFERILLFVFIRDDETK